VGGKRFRTTRQTLQSDPTSMLAKMFTPGSTISPGIKKVAKGSWLPPNPIPTSNLVEEVGRQGKMTEGEVKAWTMTTGHATRETARASTATTGTGSLCTLFEQGSTLEEMVTGQCMQLLEKDGNLFFDQDPNDFSHIFLRTSLIF